jgi:dihydroorotate dehydrogenase (NAD+) catalytic subunit
VVARRAASSATGVAGDLTVELCGISLTTPLIPAAGTLSKEMLEEVSDVYGAILPKTVTPKPRTGNPPPRVAEAPSGMVNSIGLQNPGLERFLKGLGDYEVGLPLFVSVAANTVGEFAEMCETLGRDERVTAGSSSAPGRFPSRRWYRPVARRCRRSPCS